MALLMLGGIIITITRKDGTTTTVQVPEGADVTIEKDGRVVAQFSGGTTSPGVRRGNYALQFDGKSTYVSLRSLRLPDKQPFTIEGYVRQAEQNGAGYLICSLHQGKGIGIGIGNGNKTFVCATYSKGEYAGIVTPQKTPLEKPLHWAAVFDGDQLALYVDGRWCGQKSIADMSPQGAGFILGANPNATGVQPEGEFFHGLIDEIRISRVARYTKDFTPESRFIPDKETLALYHCDEARGNVLRDSSGHGRHGRIFGARWVAASHNVEKLQP